MQTNSRNGWLTGKRTTTQTNQKEVSNSTRQIILDIKHLPFSLSLTKLKEKKQGRWLGLILVSVPFFLLTKNKKQVKKILGIKELKQDQWMMIIFP